MTYEKLSIVKEKYSFVLLLVYFVDDCVIIEVADDLKVFKNKKKILKRIFHNNKLWK